MDRKTFSELIDAYAAAKVSQNQVLQKMIVGELQEALNAVFTRLEASEASQEMEAENS